MNKTVFLIIIKIRGEKIFHNSYRTLTKTLIFCPVFSILFLGVAKDMISMAFQTSSQIIKLKKKGANNSDSFTSFKTR